MRNGKLALLVASMALVASALIPAAASAWAPAKTAAVHPGVQVFTEGAQCTSNFVFEEGTTVYLGQAAHCSGTGGQTETDGCTSGSLPIGTPVEVTGASKPGHPRLQLLADDAGQGRDQPRHLRLQRPGADQDRPGRRRQGQPLGARLRRPDRGRQRGRRPRLDRLLLRQLRTARRDHQAEPEAGHRDPERRQRLEPHRRHPDPRHPR